MFIFWIALKLPMILI